MSKKRTDVNFSKHEVITYQDDKLIIHHLKKPDTYADSVKFINVEGVLVVTGDYSNWMFCREFVPSPIGYADSQYWKEKLQINSCQEPSKYDAVATEARIKELIEDEDTDEESKKWLNDILTYADDEYEYIYHAFRKSPRHWDSENVPFVKTVNYHFLVVLDAFDEICSRMKVSGKELETVKEKI